MIGKLVVKPQFMENIEEDFHSVRFEEEDLKRKLEGMLAYMNFVLYWGMILCKLSVGQQTFNYIANKGFFGNELALS